MIFGRKKKKRRSSQMLGVLLLRGGKDEPSNGLDSGEKKNVEGNIQSKLVGQNLDLLSDSSTKQSLGGK